MEEAAFCWVKGQGSLHCSGKNRVISITVQGKLHILLAFSKNVEDRRSCIPAIHTYCKAQRLVGANETSQEKINFRAFEFYLECQDEQWGALQLSSCFPFPASRQVNWDMAF